MSREAIEEAIEVLEDASAEMLMETGDKNYYIEAIAVLRQALVDADDTSQERVDEIVKDEHEPVAWANLYDLQNFDMKVRTSPDLHHTVPLYTAPQPAQKPLIPSMEEAVAAGDAVLMNEQASLLRECRAALDSLIAQKPTLAGLVCGSTTLGNLKAELGAYRPQGVFGSAKSIKKKKKKEWVGLTALEVYECWKTGDVVEAVEAKLKEKNT